MAISSLGVGSGLDLSALLKNLVSAERVPTENRLNNQEATLQAKISAYGSLRGALSTIESPLKRLSEFESKMSVTNSDKDALSVQADADAPAGKFTIEVDHIATAQSLATDTTAAETYFAVREDAETSGANTEVVAAGTSASFSVQIGSNDATVIDLEGGDDGLTLADLRDAINDADAGVTASIINDGSGARLVMTADETGAANTIQTTANGFDGAASGGMNDALSLDGSDTEGNGQITQAASDALATINGITINSASNTLDGAVDGLSITLLGATDSAASVQVAEDRSAMRSILNEFVGGYNELINQTNSFTAYNAENNSGALLTGDSTVRAVRSMLGNSMVEFGRVAQDYGPTEIDGEEVSVRVGDNLGLASLGIVSSKTGTLGFDQTKFNDAVEIYGMENVVGAVKEITGKFHAAVTSFSDSTDGMLAARTKGLRASVDDIGLQREALDERIMSLEERLSAQFAAMDSLVAQMNSTSNYLASQLANLPGLGSK
ncbi:flagellar filament capping protein FliD [Thiorhodovibrio litoralis]|uniref:flagellar filament capping protein FliD n=1 Tax=Thiorhodovibrio litoralis TaxID=2952932 RepID=UPI002B256CC1|nr:flagellar filament capping protein FliD [Thiorhodovibrio litoralis]WPL11579.1 Flagellar cap protein [Thiorhodovibrio litoralis]